MKHEGLFGHKGGGGESARETGVGVERQLCRCVTRGEKRKTKRRIWFGYHEGLAW